MIEEACTCEGLPAHIHLPTHWATIDGVYRPVFDDPFWLRVWVDWRTVARSFIAEDAIQSQPGEMT